jgi:hypothetical protein
MCLYVSVVVIRCACLSSLPPAENFTHSRFGTFDSTIGLFFLRAVAGCHLIVLSLIYSTLQKMDSIKQTASDASSKVSEMAGQAKGSAEMLGQAEGSSIRDDEMSKVRPRMRTRHEGRQYDERKLAKRKLRNGWTSRRKSSC